MYGNVVLLRCQQCEILRCYGPLFRNDSKHWNCVMGSGFHNLGIILFRVSKFIMQENFVNYKFLIQFLSKQARKNFSAHTN
jgi:hypothetical protein